MTCITRWRRLWFRISCTCMGSIIKDDFYGSRNYDQEVCKYFSTTTHKVKIKKEYNVHMIQSQFSTCFNWYLYCHSTYVLYLCKKTKKKKKKVSPLKKKIQWLYIISWLNVINESNFLEQKFKYALEFKVLNTRTLKKDTDKWRQ